MTDDPRLYLITPPQLPDLDIFARDLAETIAVGGVAALQLRLKAPDGGPAPRDLVRRAADALMPVANRADVAFIINDDPEIAAGVGADGVHVGQSDASYARAREIVGEEATVGVTCHASMHLAMEAGEAGADYVAFGAFFPTTTKDAPALAEPDILDRWSVATTVPCVAIGGITPENCRQLIEAGADFLAVSGAVWNDPAGPAAAIARFNATLA